MCSFNQKIRNEVKGMYGLDCLSFKHLSPFFDKFGYELDENEEGYTIFEPDDYSDPYEFTTLFGVIEFMYLNKEFFEAFLNKQDLTK